MISNTINLLRTFLSPLSLYKYFAMADGAVPVHNTGTMVEAKSNQVIAKLGLVQKLQGGAIIEVTDVEQAQIAEEAGACSIVIHHGISQPNSYLIKDIKQAVSIPIMARVRVGHFVEAQILEAMGVDCIDESELLGIADSDNYINKHKFHVPFACKCQHLREAMMRAAEGAAIIWLHGSRNGWNSSTSGTIVETIQNVRSVMKKVRSLTDEDEDEVLTFSMKMGVPYDIVAQTKQIGRLPVMQIAAGGIQTPADAALMMQLGCDGVLVGSDIFSGLDPYRQVRSIVQAVKYYNDPYELMGICFGLEDVEAGSEVEYLG
ncbi:pyridoxal 5'-phosphate synthase-like subunit PDX1.2 [Pistacia vera]|uniref:pyridoxal 5'-phosphate synthase-like subunit PDX1.2 n=1 Tax=Pistacia vera TaxID=55513 RepID=UPI0012633A03|nr:pyridoxal 5'-phosphate synthase-like subunit PDX1.2 [Pistacia vera]